MAIDRYFDKFPIIDYNNQKVIDITRKVSILDRVNKNPFVFYPYDINNYEREDQLSSRYYEDPFKSWLLYFANDIVDPYYEWYLSETEFIEFIIKKYGSVELAMNKIKNYRNNWEHQPNISLSEYNALSSNQKKYWNPIYNEVKIIGYERKTIDWYTNTNKIHSYELQNKTLKFIVDEVCEIYIDEFSYGRGQVMSYESGVLKLQHLSGDYFDSEDLTLNSNSYLVGKESGSQSIITDTYQVVTNINSDEEIYWKPLTYYDHEYEKNEFNKSVRIIDKNLADLAVNNLTDLLES